VSSDEHVDVKLLNGTLTADRLRIYNSGELVRFDPHSPSSAQVASLSGD